MQQKETFKLSRVLITIFFLALIVIPAALAYKYKDILGVVVSTKTSTERMIADAVLPISVRNVFVNCQPIDQKDDAESILTRGETPFIGSYATPVILLSEETCQNIEAFSELPNKNDASKEQLQALITIAHEAFHTTGVVEEDKAECYAVQRIISVSHKLGATLDEAQSIQSRAVSLQRRTASEGYISKDCHNNGPYDLDPDSLGTFPY